MTARRLRTGITVTDQFCGAGGSSIGAVAAGAELRLAMNHWKVAIETHNSNFPNAAHACADISTTDPRRFESTDILITSPECTNHSRAKKRPKGDANRPTLFNVSDEEERSRATMWDVPRFAEYHDYRIIVVENVVEAHQWALFPSWVHAMKALGYEGRPVYMNSMVAHPTPQSRDRMYYVWWKAGNRAPNLDFPAVAMCPDHGQVDAYQSWKQRTAAWPAEQWGKYRTQYVYRCPECHTEVEPLTYPAASAIDWSIKGQRIGDRDVALKPATLARIQRGLDTFGGMGPIMVPTGGNTFERDGYTRCRPTEWPMNAVTTELCQALVVPVDHADDPHGKKARPASEPFATQTGRLESGLAFMPFIAELRGGGSNERSVAEPLCTVEAGGNHHMLVAPSFIVKNYGTDPNGHGCMVKDPTAGPLGAVTAQDHHALVSMPFTVNYNGTGTPEEVTEPLRTVSCRDRYGLVQPSAKPTIDDCTFRMLEPHEIQRAMAFPGAYKIVGNKRQVVRQLGNAVTPPVSDRIVQACIESLS
jgi:DNA (cytosine-5)-methyltransferase 1